MPPSPRGNAFGEQLKRAREARGMTLDAIADATRVSRHHLEALERSDLDALPAGPFARGYIEAYTRVLGIDPRPILATYRARESQRGLGSPEDDRRMLDEMSHLLERRGGATGRGRLGGRTPLLLIVGLAVVALATLGWFLARHRRLQPPAPPAAAARPTVPTASPLAAPARAGRRAGPAAPPPAGAAKPPRPAVVPPTAELAVSAHGVGTGIADHRLAGRSDRFPEGTAVVFWTSVVGGRPGQVIRHVWFQDGRAVTRAELPIRGSNWRTFSQLVLPRGSVGPWRVEARASDGRLLARDEFVCEATP